ncbi:MAG: HAMP domain-containing histidine kinase, partial [Clostridia bacterium]|nr:HAMP domain-containing histidine kinase [Clostridia bacterium]
MSTLKKSRFGSIGSKIFLSMLALILLMLIILWLTQTVFLSTFYEFVKRYAAYNASENICENIDDKELPSLVVSLADYHNACIKIVNASRGFSVVNQCDIHNEEFDCVMHSINYNSDLYKNWLERANENDGFYLEILEKDKFDNSSFDPDAFKGKIPDISNDHIISVTTTTNGNGDTILVIVNSSIQPIDSTVRTIRSQLIFTSVFMIFVAFIVAYLVSKHMSSPIVDINNKAKALSKGNYEVHFEEKGTIETIELAKTLNHTVEELSKLDKLQKDLIANISHDLRTPLTMISGYSEVMRDIPGENTPENMQVIIDETARLSSLVNDLLNVSKLQSGTQRLELSEINLTEVVRKSIDRYEHLISHNGYNVSFDYREDVYIMADEVRLLQVVYNLINNAINYTGPDKRVRVVQRITDDVVRISVIDTGAGIGDEDLPLIWDRYYKVDKVHTRAKIGTGLGLSIVKNILLLHGSRFGVSSEIGEGSTFWFEFKITNIVRKQPEIESF